MKLALAIVVLCTITAAFASTPVYYKPTRYCTPDSSHQDTYCRCLFYHPKEEFCASDTAPLPSCCRATEKNSKIKACACCRSVYGSKRNISIEDRGMYEHVQPVVEYDIK